MKKALVTGGAGFIGSNLVDRLIKDGIKVTVLDNLSTGNRANVNPKANFIMCDIAYAENDFLINHLTGIDVVFHTAAKARVQPSIDEPVSFNETNVNGTLNLLLASHRAKVKRFV